MRKRLNLIVIFYVLYFTWLFTLIFLSSRPDILTIFLLCILAFYFLFLYEKYDFWFFSLVYIGSIAIGGYVAYDPAFNSIGFPPLGVPYWPFAWGITTLAMRKFYISINKGYAPSI